MKSSKLTINQRVAEVSEMLINGVNRASIVHYSSDNWDISERQVDKYISKARELIQSDIIKNLEFDYAKSIKRYESLYQKAIEIKDYRLALTVNKEITQLQGLSKMQIEHSGDVQFICSIPD